jgi:hypothetical protein
VDLRTEPNQEPAYDLFFEGCTSFDVGFIPGEGEQVDQTDLCQKGLKAIQEAVAAIKLDMANLVKEHYRRIGFNDFLRFLGNPGPLNKEQTSGIISIGTVVGQNLPSRTREQERTSRKFISGLRDKTNQGLKDAKDIADVCRGVLKDQELADLNAAVAEYEALMGGVDLFLGQVLRSIGTITA